MKHVFPVIALALAAFWLPVGAWAEPVKILAFGDSLTGGYELPEPETYPMLLQRKLIEKGYDVKVINAGLSGETTQGGRARINWVLRAKPDIVILELGVNDSLRGFETETIYDNLNEQIERLKEKQVKVLLCAMPAIGTRDPEYIKKFEAIFSTLRDEHKIAYVPNFMEAIMGKEELTLPDRLHPNPKGMEYIAELILPELEALVKEVVKKKPRKKS